jgi:hypothetical protein
MLAVRIKPAEAGQEPLKRWLKILPTANDKVVALAVEWHEIHPALTRHSSDAKASVGFPVADSQGEFGLTPYRRANTMEAGRIKMLLPQEMLEQETTVGAFLARYQAYSAVLHVRQVSNVVRVASGTDQALFAPGPFDKYHIETSQGAPGNGPVIISRVRVKDVQTDGTINGMHVAMTGTFRSVVRDSHFHNSANYGFGADCYGIVLRCGAADNLVENNIARYMNKPILFSVSGGVMVA